MPRSVASWASKAKDRLVVSELWLTVSSSLPLKVPQFAGWVEGFENPGASTLENWVIWDLGRLA